MRWLLPAIPGVGTNGVLLRPIEKGLAWIDDAAAVPPARRPGLLPAEIIERAALDAEELGRLVNGQKFLIAEGGHRKPPESNAHARV